MISIEFYCKTMGGLMGSWGLPEVPRVGDTVLLNGKFYHVYDITWSINNVATHNPVRVALTEFT